MLHFLGFMLFLVLVILLVGFLIVVLLVRRLFRVGKDNGKGSTFYYRSQRRPDTWSNGSRNADAYTVHAATDSQSSNDDDEDVVAVEEGELHFKRKKIFDKDEGEYVSYEEVKE